MNKKVEETYTEIGNYFGKSDSWLRGSNSHRKKMLELYGVISIDSIHKYYQYQQDLRNYFVKVCDSGFFSRAEIAKMCFGQRKTSSVFSQFYNRMLYSRNEDDQFMSLRIVNQIENLKKEVNKKLDQLEELR